MSDLPPQNASGELGDDNEGNPGMPTLADTGVENAATEAVAAEADTAPESSHSAGGASVDPNPASTRFSDALRQILASSGLLTVLAVVISLVISGVLIAATNLQVQTAAVYFFSRPSDTFIAIGQAVGGAYASLFQGGVYDFTAPDFATGIMPLLSSLSFATPLIAAGLGIAVAFRAGLFNIGGQGMVLIGGAAAGWIGINWHLPFGIHLLVAVAFGLLGGGIWAFIVGILKAKTGAHEVIVTIMLNYVAIYLIDYLLQTPVLQAPGSAQPKSADILSTALLFPLFGPQYGVNFGFVLAILATIYCWWLLNRSSLGFKFRAIGENPKAARVAGMNVDRLFVYVLVISGALVGLAGAYQTLGQGGGGITDGFDAGIGFNAITVALLGRSRPWGVFAAGILFGIVDAGGYAMQAANNVDINIVTVLQAVVVLFIAAPPLVRAIFRLPAPGAKRKSGPRQIRKEAVAK